MMREWLQERLVLVCFSLKLKKQTNMNTRGNIGYSKSLKEKLYS